MAKDIVFPVGLTIDRDCISLLQKHLSDRMIEREQNGENIGIDIYFRRANHFGIRYNHHFYKTTIIKKGTKYYWYLEPYNKSYFIYPAEDRNSFDVVIRAIKDNDTQRSFPKA